MLVAKCTFLIIEIINIINININKKLVQSKNNCIVSLASFSIIDVIIISNYIFHCTITLIDFLILLATLIYLISIITLNLRNKKDSTNHSRR